MPMTKNLRNQSMRAISIAGATLALAAVFCGSASAEVYVYNVSVPTDVLNANSVNGPFSMLFELTDGSGTGDGNNTVTMTNFSAGPSDPVTLTDNGLLVYDIEGFTPAASPGSTLSFDLSTTNNSDTGGTPDEFSFYLLDGNYVTLPTTDEANSSLFTVDLGGFTPSVTTFETQDNYAGIDPIVTPLVATPEPQSWVSLGIGGLALMSLILVRLATGKLRSRLDKRYNLLYTDFTVP